MPCTSPLQGYFSGLSGQFKFSQEAQDAFRAGIPLKGTGAVPCGQCLECRLKRSRDWAVRSVHESSDYEANSFLTLTFSPESMDELCPKAIWQDPFNLFSPESQQKPVEESYSILREHMQLFVKRLRDRLSPHRIRVMYCGEYGGKTMRPHYHAIIFNYDFPDRSYYRTIDGYKYYNSALLSDVWPYGHALLSDFSFNTAAYVGRYVVEKVGGKHSDSHYKGRVPEFNGVSRAPGLGAFWFERNWRDLYPRDECVVRVDKKVMILKPPRYYDKLLEELNPDMYEEVVARRRLKVEENKDGTYERLRAIHDCNVSRFKRLIRRLQD